MAGEKGKARFKTAEELEEAANAYFDKCDAEGTLYSEPGLALALGVTLEELRQWWEGAKRPGLRKAVRRAYLRITDQILTDPRYMEKSGMNSRAAYLLKQPWFGGYQDRAEAKHETSVSVKFGSGMDESDFK